MKSPCEQCISFAICNGKIRESRIPDVVKYSTVRGCVDLRDYLFGKQKDRVTKTRVAFGLPPRKPPDW